MSRFRQSGTVVFPPSESPQTAAVGSTDAGRPDQRIATLTAHKDGGPLPAKPPDGGGDRSPSEAEQLRWIVPLVLCFAWAAGFFMAAIGTGRFWLLGPAALGFALMILGFVYLGLTSDTNDGQ
jgi:hypothetical protein